MRDKSAPLWYNRIDSINGGLIMKRFFSFVLAFFVLLISSSLAVAEEDYSLPSGTDVVKFASWYYQRKSKISEMTGNDMKYGTFDICTENSAYIDGFSVGVTDSNRVYFLFIRESDLSDLARSIPAIYALKVDASDDYNYEILAKAGISTPDYWLTSYKTDFTAFLSSSKEKPIEWGDYYAYSDVSPTDDSSSVIYFVLKDWP